MCACVQVLFWGLRELKRVELFEVSRPFVRMECAGRQLESEEIENFKFHPNFKEMVRCIEVVSGMRSLHCPQRASTSQYKHHL